MAGNLVGTLVGNWRLESLIGEGGMGFVYLARHQSLGTPMAVKVLSDTLTHDTGARERFFQEARTQAQLVHPRIVQVLDFLHQAPHWFLISEYMSGGSLEQALAGRPGPIEIPQALAWTRQTLDALDFAHRAGIIHRDVKPSNLLLDGAGEVKVTDFGIAVVLGGRRLTRTGVSLGTPHYMSPEQIRRPKDVDHRSDVYSMGLVLYELLTGRVPFESDTGSDFDVQHAQVNHAPPPLREFNPGLPEDLEGIVLKALAKEPDDRYGGCGAFARALEEFQGDNGTGPQKGEEKDKKSGTGGIVPRPDGAEEERQRLRTRAKVRTLQVWLGILGVLLLVCLIALIAGCAVLDDVQGDLRYTRGQLSDKEKELLDAEAEIEEAEEELDEMDEALDALQHLAAARAWRVIAQEDFTANHYIWSPGTFNGERADIIRSLLRDQYVWSVTAKQGFVAWDWPVVDKPRDFSLEVNAGTYHCSGPCSYGLQFRRHNDNNYYIFRVRGDQFLVELLEEGTWKTLVPLTSSPHIRPESANRLTVVAEGSRMSFFVNDSLLTQITDSTLSSGGVALVVGLSSAGEKGDFWFDNFVLRAKP